MPLKITSLPEFDKDFAKLLKRFRTLEEDLKTFIETDVESYHKRNIDRGAIVRIPGLPFQEPKVYKAKKFACRALKGKGAQSGIRVIYAYFEEQDKIEFIEIYYKGDKENEDKDRISRYYKKS